MAITIRSLALETQFIARRRLDPAPQIAGNREVKPRLAFPSANDIQPIPGIALGRGVVYLKTER